MIVTELRKSFLSKKLYEVYLDYEYAFSLYENELRLFGVEHGKEINEVTLEKIYKKLQKNAINDSLRSLARADYTKKMIEDKLEKKKYPFNIIEEAVTYLEKNGFINDSDYSKHFVKSSISKGKGRKYIEFELKKRGISDYETKNLLEEFYSDNKISLIACKKWNSIIKNKENPTYNDYNKLKDYLLRQGFGYDEIGLEINRIKENNESE